MPLLGARRSAGDEENRISQIGAKKSIDQMRNVFVGEDPTEEQDDALVRGNPQLTASLRATDRFWITASIVPVWNYESGSRLQRREFGSRLGYGKLGEGDEPIQHRHQTVPKPTFCFGIQELMAMKV